MQPIDILKKAKEALSWRELRPIWVLLPFLLGTFAIVYSFLSLQFLIIVTGLLFGTAVTVSVGLYRAAKQFRDNSIERNELKSILYGLEDSILVYDQGFKILFLNPSAEKLFGFEPNRVLGETIGPQDIERKEKKLLAQIVFPSLAPAVISRSAAGEYPQVVDLSFEEPQLELRVTTSPISADGSGLLGFVKIIRNRTREINIIKSKGEFLTVASHQLRTPVTEIRWALESLGQENNLTDSAKTVLGEALKSSDYLLKIIEDLLGVARIEEGRFGYNFEEKDIAEFINEVLARIAPLARHAGIKIYFDQPKIQLPKVLIDSEKLSLALGNLLENAVKYNIENGQVIVKIDQVPNQPFLEILVSDTGIGIPENDLGKLFDKFFRAENALKLETSGSGLGLYIARNIIRSHGGRITVESEVGRGTTFKFTLPTDPSLVPRHEMGIE